MSHNLVLVFFKLFRCSITKKHTVDNVGMATEATTKNIDNLTGEEMSSKGYAS